MRRLLTLVIAAVALLAACGDDDHQAATTAAPSTTCAPHDHMCHENSGMSPVPGCTPTDHACHESPADLPPFAIVRPDGCINLDLVPNSDHRLDYAHGEWSWDGHVFATAPTEDSCAHRTAR